MRRITLGWAALVVLIGCGSDVSYVGDGEGGADPCPDGNCTPPTCPTNMPTEGASCELPDMTECRYPDPDWPGCDHVYVCSPVYPEAGAPSRWYYHGEQGSCTCSAVACDPGDTEVTECPAYTECYTVENTCDGTELLCADTASPPHGCPLNQPNDGEMCDEDGLNCDYHWGDGCFVNMLCDSGQWVTTTSACPGSGGSGGS
jgi:hypothetical protein